MHRCGSFGDIRPLRKHGESKDPPASADISRTCELLIAVGLCKILEQAVTVQCLLANFLSPRSTPISMVLEPTMSK